MNHQQQNQLKLLAIIKQLEKLYTDAVRLGLPDKSNRSIYRSVNSIIIEFKKLL